jgi:hypothetical protein
MEPERSLLSLQDFAIGAYPGPDKLVHTFPLPFFNIHFNITP